MKKKSPTNNSIILALGSNIGNKEANILKAIGYLQSKVFVKKISSFYESSPVDYLEQDSFLNICIEIVTILSPLKLLDCVQSIEKKMKRGKKINKGPRNIDIDIIFYKDKVLQYPRLQIPHPSYSDRLFVLLPLLEIMGNQIDPKTKRDFYFYRNLSFPNQKIRYTKQNKKSRKRKTHNKLLKHSFFLFFHFYLV